MHLAKALRVLPGRSVAFVGAGGKTTAMARLAGELSPLGPVIMTTTTRMARTQASLAQVHRVVHSPADLAGLSQEAGEKRTLLVTAPAVPGEPKWQGLDGAMMAALRRAADELGATLLVEADGARGRSLKAPAEHEPVIPPFVDLVVPVAALDALGQPLQAGCAHRPELLARLLGVPLGTRLEPEHFAAALGHVEGGLKGVPPKAEVRMLLNKVDAARLDAGRAVAAGLLGRAERVQAAVLASVAREDPVREVWGRVAGVVLAAGGSSRMGRPKQLLTWRGRPLVWHAVQAALDGGLEPVVVVLGAQAQAVRRALRGEQVVFVENQGWSRGQSTSVRLGLQAVQQGAEGVVFLLADMPLVDQALVAGLVGEHRRTLAPLVAPQVRERWGNPVLFDRVTFTALRELEGDRGGRALFEDFPVHGYPWDERATVDVDTEADLARLEEDSW